MNGSSLTGRTNDTSWETQSAAYKATDTANQEDTLLAKEQKANALSGAVTERSGQE